ncbi:hypothetical protein AUJ68_00270 [Candidatus Woesearchaeota archaeon CG1_02_57_44]|nr:MAG: hypothetical protein AUJ68_00270 [Candidatus Woesearchaeota archaeon CG1_02_57_44]PIN69100.1 MAG: hypothetical protein COV94_03305 [Candidatus Woesearchaeota archaeon CG11_big_fil_rev_8_21_14_0_20_57_5]
MSKYQGKYQIVAAIASRETVKPIMLVATAIAKQKHQGVTVITVVGASLREGRAPLDEAKKVLDAASVIGKAQQVPITAHTLMHQDAGTAIAGFILRNKSDIAVLGWSGRIFAAKIHRSVPDRVLQEGRCATCIIKPKAPTAIKRILVPVSQGSPEHFYRLSIAAHVAKSMGASVTLATIARGKPSQQERALLERARQLMGMRADKKIVSGTSVEQGIIDLSKAHDLVVLGPSRDWVLHDFLFGRMVDGIANGSHCSVMMVKRPSRHEGVLVRMVQRFHSFRARS